MLNEKLLYDMVLYNIDKDPKVQKEIIESKSLATIRYSKFSYERYLERRVAVARTTEMSKRWNKSEY